MLRDLCCRSHSVPTKGYPSTNHFCKSLCNFFVSNILVWKLNDICSFTYHNKAPFIGKLRLTEANHCNKKTILENGLNIFTPFSGTLTKFKIEPSYICTLYLLVHLLMLLIYFLHSCRVVLRYKSLKVCTAQSAFYLPCKIWRLIFSMLQKIFIRVKFFSVQAANNFFHAAKLYIMQLWLELFLVICTKISKKCQMWRISWPNLSTSITSIILFCMGCLKFLRRQKITSSMKKYLQPDKKKYFLQGR